MTARRKIDPEAPPTNYLDWVGAYVRTGLRRPEPIEGGMMFHLYRSSANPGLMIATDGELPTQRVNCPNGGQWITLKSFPEAGVQRADFSEEGARADILRYGFHLIYIAHSSRPMRWPDLRRKEPKRRRTTRALASGSLTFPLFRASTERSLFLVTDGPDPAAVVDCPDGGLWMPLKRLPATGEAWIGFSEARATADIQRQGSHLIDLERCARKHLKGAERVPRGNRPRRNSATSPRSSKRRATR